MTSSHAPGRFTRRWRILRHRYRFVAGWKRWFAVSASVLAWSLVLGLFAYLFAAIAFAGAALVPGNGLNTWGYEPPLEYPVFRIPWWVTLGISCFCSVAIVVLTATSKAGLDWYRSAEVQRILSVGAAAVPPVFSIFYPLEWGAIPYPWDTSYYFGPEIWAVIPGFASVIIALRIHQRAFRDGGVPSHHQWAADQSRAVQRT